MTRAKFKAYVLGLNSTIMDSFKLEYETIQEKNYSLDFKYPTEEQLKEIKTIAKKEEIKVAKINKASDIIGNDDDILIELLRNKFGSRATDELLKFIQDKE